MNPPPVEFWGPLEAVRLIRAGIVRPWSWEEWQGLPESFVRRTLDAWEVVLDVEAVYEGKGGGAATGPQTGPVGDDMESSLSDTSKTLDPTG